MDTSPPQGQAEVQPRCTEAEKELRINEVVDLISRSLRQRIYQKHRVKKFLRDTYGILARGAEDYIRWAWERIRADAATNTENELVESIEYWRGIATDPKEKEFRRDNARKQLDKLLGLAKITVTHEGKIEQGLPPDQFAALRQELLGSVDHVEALRRAVTEVDSQDASP